MLKPEEILALKPKSCLGTRHLQAFMLFLSTLLAFGMRVNMSMAIVSMNDPDDENSFNWSSQKQSVILSSFFWGYMVLQIPGGEIAARYGGKMLILSCIGINAAFSLLVPLCAFYGGWQLVVVCRVMQGVGQGVFFPTIHNLIGKWIPLDEKSRYGTFIYSGALLGTAIQMMAGGFISEYWGWPGIFYFNGALGAIWTVAYAFVGSSSPATSRVISDEEKLYIQTSLGHVVKQKKLPTPWKSIFTSMSFISLIMVHAGHNWGFWTLMTEMPSYMKQVLGADISANGVMSALPYLTIYLMSFPVGYLSDFVLKKKWISITASRKISNSIGHYGPAIALIGLSYVPAGDLTTAVIVLCLVVGLNAGHFTGFLLVHIDMAPNFSGTMMGITNTFANLISIIAPLVAGALLKDQTDPEQWKIVFYISSAVYVVCNTFFVIFGSSETQPWNFPKTEEIENNTDVTVEKGTEKAV